MTLGLRLSSWIYRGLLLFYPCELREDFGDEMTEAFTEDLARARGALGIASVWCCALSELVTIAVPRRLADPWVRTLMMATALQIATLGGVLAIAAVHQAMPSEIWHGVVTANLHFRR
jgi:hypothetical protein